MELENPIELFVIELNLGGFHRPSVSGPCCIVIDREALCRKWEGPFVIFEGPVVDDKGL